MKFLPVLLLGLMSACPMQAPAQANIRLNDITLMHESRMTVSPANGCTFGDRFVSFQWPLPENLRERMPVGDGEEEVVAENSTTYKIRYSRDAAMKKGVRTIETVWPFYNAHEICAPATYYWQYAYTDGKNDRWSPVYSFTYTAEADRFAPPSFKDFSKAIPKSHPRVLTDARTWDKLIARSASMPEREWYIEYADKAMATPVGDINNVPTEHLKNLQNESQRNGWLTRESRRIIDAEEKNVNALVRAYVLTRDEKYARAALDRTFAVAEWNDHELVKGDFNDATLLSLCTLAYDTFYNILNDSDKARLRKLISDKAGRLYYHYNNYLENHIAENHIWQMTLRLLSDACVAVYGDIPESGLWMEYCYNVWLARFPGLNADGAWHNGDSYYTVNTRTLVETPYIYQRFTGFDFFSDPWYRNNIKYAIYHQPPFSKSAGNGSSHGKKLAPNGERIGLVDAIARLTGDSYGADYVRTTLARVPGILKKTVCAKAGDLCWWRILAGLPLPDGPGLDAMPHGYVFPQSGLATWSNSLSDTGTNAMWSFRSSPYGSTSHAVANQNAFNTFYGGESLFYSSGHQNGFLDHHSLLCERSTRAHNTILVDGMCQRLGTEGYGWIPRHYMGKELGYVVGDASNAYGKIISPLWIKRGKECELDYTPANGWDENRLLSYRRHIVNLGNDGLMMIYDELEADRPVEWSYLLHTVLKPMETDGDDSRIHITARNSKGASDAWLSGSGMLSADTTSRFFVAPHNWLIADANGNFRKYPDHWHFTAKSNKSRKYRFVTFIHTHGNDTEPCEPQSLADGRIAFGTWTVAACLDSDMPASFSVCNADGSAALEYHGEETRITEGGDTKVLIDEIPELEI